MPQDKRRTPRLGVDVKVAFGSAGASEEPVAFRRKAGTVNLSMGGFLLKTPSYEPVGGSIRGGISIPGAEEPISFRAALVWKRPAGTRDRLSGFMFTGMSETDRRRLDAFLKSVFVQTLTVY